MVRLDCHDLASTLGSLSAAAGVSPQVLETAMRSFREPDDWGHTDPFTEMPRLIFVEFGTTVEQLGFADACYFHGTRVREPERFMREGIRPLGSQAEELWSLLYDLVAGECDPRDWAVFRRSVEEGQGHDDGWYYRNRISANHLHGPYAAVVRECLLDPEPMGWHDYLACPETVMDIARSYKAEHGVDLQARFCQATLPCIVKFRSDELKSGAICAATWYVYWYLRHGELTSNSSYGPSGEGEPVVPSDVLGVEVVESSGSKGWRAVL